MKHYEAASSDTQPLIRYCPKNAFTLAEVFSPYPIGQYKNAFTLAEVLITIGIIGVVAVLTLPSVINFTKDKEYAAAKKKMLYTISEATKSIAGSGYTKDSENAKDFVENQLRKQVQMIKTCDNNNLRDCGIETRENKIFNLSETAMTMPTKISDLATGISTADTDGSSTSYGFVMSNGYAVNLFYNPKCKSDDPDANHYGQDRVCVNVIYDMNGLAAPNQVGKDIGFVTMIYPDITVKTVAPDPYKKNASGAAFNDTGTVCSALDKELSPPNRDELLSMYYNSTLVGITSGGYWSSSEASSELGWYQNFTTGYRSRYAKSNGSSVRCVRR